MLADHGHDPSDQGERPVEDVGRGREAIGGIGEWGDRVVDVALADDRQGGLGLVARMDQVRAGEHGGDAGGEHAHGHHERDADRGAVGDRSLR